MSDAPHTWHRWGEPLAVALNIAYTLGYQAGEAWAFPAGGFGSALLKVLSGGVQLGLAAGRVPLLGDEGPKPLAAEDHPFALELFIRTLHRDQRHHQVSR